MWYDLQETGKALQAREACECSSKDTMKPLEILEQGNDVIYFVYKRILAAVQKMNLGKARIKADELGAALTVWSTRANGLKEIETVEIETNGYIQCMF